MSAAMLKMWLSLGAVFFLFISVLLILASRHKLHNQILKFVTAFIAYVLMFISGIVIFLILFWGAIGG